MALRTAVAGLGRIGWQYHLPSIRSHEGFDIAAVADVDAHRRGEAAGEYGVKTYSKFGDMIAKEKLDLVVICTPTHLHAEHAIAAMENGVDVFLDKPVAANTPDAIAVLDTAERTGRKLMMYQPWRIRRETLAVREILASGLLGDLYMIRLYETRYVRRKDWQAMKKYGGGMLNNSASHFIDLLVYLTGCGDWDLVCQLINIASAGDAEDFVKLNARTKDGLIIDLEINCASAAYTPRWTLLGDRGSAVFERTEDGAEQFRVRHFDPVDIEPAELDESLAAADRKYINEKDFPWREKVIDISTYPDIEYYEYCYRYFARGEPPFVPLEDTRSVVGLMDLCRKSSM